MIEQTSTEDVEWNSVLASFKITKQEIEHYYKLSEVAVRARVLVISSLELF